MKRVVTAPLAACAFVACHPGQTQTAWTLDNLTPDKGISIRIPDFDVPPASEVQDCYFFKIPDLDSGKDIWIERVLTAINAGSHHMNLFRVKTIKSLDPASGDPTTIGDNIPATVVHGGPPGPMMGECWKSANWSDWPLVVNSQNSEANDPYTDWTLPAGVAYRFSPGEQLMLQTHYVNATTQKTLTKGKVGVNLYRHPDDGTTPMEVGTAFATNQSIRVCESTPTPEYTATCRFAKNDVTIIAANGHFHSRGRKFTMYPWDGMSTTPPAESTAFYQSLTWNDPPMKRDMNVPVAANGGITYTCEYQWMPPASGCDAVNARDKMMANDCCYTFGPIVETSEHCNAFVYYYPKGSSDAGCF
jgi:hypothetical protein